MDTDSLRKFLIESNKAGYFSGEEKKWIKEPNNSTTIPYVRGPWRAHDNFFGGEPYGGRLVIFYENKPVWIMVYYGYIAKEEDTNPIYSVLRNALMKMPDDIPLRGPSEYKEGNLIYTNRSEGNLEQFSGEESINRDNKKLYKSNYRGGLVDQRQGV